MIREYRRKVQLVGGSTLVVSLPKEWTRSARIEPGDILSIKILPDGSLLIAPLEKSEIIKSEYIVEVYSDSDPTMVLRKVIAGYLAGYLSIRLVKKDLDAQGIVSRIIEAIHRSVLGLEAVEEDSSSVLLQNIADTRFARISSSLRRLSRITLGMHQDVLTCLESGGDALLCNSIKGRDDIADKIYLLIIRKLVELTTNPGEALRQKITVPEAFFVALAAKNIERLADYAVSIVKIIEHDNVNIKKEILNLYREAYNIMRNALKVLIESTESEELALCEATRKADTLKKAIKNFRESMHAESTKSRLLLEVISRIIAHTIDLIEALLDLEAVRTAYSSVSAGTNEPDSNKKKRQFCT